MAYMCTTLEEFKSQIEGAGDKLVVVDFFAVWCGPCRIISPLYDNLSKEVKDVIFLKVDVDELENVVEEYNISSMPTFVFIKRGTIVDRFSGANIDKLKNAVALHKDDE